MRDDIGSKMRFSMLKRTTKL